ncbi:MAG: L,D-transpeptidase [Hyphomicrobiales bacterium]|nr:L,D-transpeptidase [Hyphomicrobiales bacterium]
MKFKSIAVAMGVTLAAALAGCSGTAIRTYSTSYGVVKDAGYQLPRIPISKVPQKYHRQLIRYETKEKPGTVIVDTDAKFLYYVMDDGRAMRYGIGVGREGFEWSGTARVGMKREWPTWTPPSEMIKREPKLAKYRDGMDPGLRNPLGARAMYLFNKKGDTGYRLHGSPEWNSIGGNVSSGCIRLINQDIIDLYNRASVGAKVIVK